MKIACSYDMIGLNVYLLYGVIKHSTGELVKAIWVGKKDDVTSTAAHVEKTKRPIRLKAESRNVDSYKNGQMFNVHVPSKGVKTFSRAVRDGYYVGGFDHIDSLESIVFANDNEELMDRGYKLFKDLMIVESSIPLIKPWVLSIMESNEPSVSNTFHKCDVIGVDGVYALEVTPIEVSVFERFLFSNFEKMTMQAQELVVV